MRFDKLGPESEYQDLAEINIIPLVDIMLVLLIVVMVAAPLSISELGVQLPVSKAQGGRIDEGRIVLTIAAGGAYYIDQQEIHPADLEAKMQAIFAVRTQKQLYINADKDVLYGQVIAAMSAAKLAGVNKLSMLTTPQEARAH